MKLRINQEQMVVVQAIERKKLIELTICTLCYQQFRRIYKECLKNIQRGKAEKAEKSERGGARQRWL